MTLPFSPQPYVRSMVLVVAFLFVAGGAAAPVPGSTQISAGAYYRFSEPGDLLMRVNVWGAAQNPGLYEIPRNTQLSTLVSLTGGPELGSRGRRTRRRIIVRVLRPTDTGYEKVFEQEMLNTPEPIRNDLPLQNHDLVVVEQLNRTRLGWRDAFTIAGGIGTVILVTERALGLF